MINNTDWELLAKYLSGECTTGEIEKVKSWLSSNPENVNAFEEMRKIWETPEEDFEQSDVKALWLDLAAKTGINNEINNEKIFRPEPQKVNNSWLDIFLTTPRYLKYAAGIIFAILIPSMIYIMFFSTPDKVFDWKTIIVEGGKQSQFTLNDGTKVILDAGSRFQFPEEFSGINREVKLKGEAYFEVTHNPEHPFIVNTGGAIVKVLGTKFNLRAWEFNKTVKVAVTEGKVSLGRISEKLDTVHITKGFAGELLSDGTLSPLKPLDIENSLSWINGEIYFNDTNLSEVLLQMERWFDVSITLSDSTILNERVSVFIHKKSLTDALKIITQLTDSEYKQIGNEITITSRNIETAE